MIKRISCRNLKNDFSVLQKIWQEIIAWQLDFFDSKNKDEFVAKKELFQKLIDLIFNQTMFIKRQVRQMIIPFIAAYPEIAEQAHFENDPQKVLAFFEDSEAIIFDQEKLSIEVKGDLRFPCKHVEMLPDNLTVVGALDITESGIKKLPSGLHVVNWLLIACTDIEELPPDLYVEGDFDMPQNIIKSIPPTIRVGGDIEIGTEELLEDARRLRANGNLKGVIRVRGIMTE